MNKGRLFVVSGPSGVGKGTIVEKLMPLCPNMALSVSATTRQPRVGEKDGVHYYFLTREQFDETVKTDGFLEYDDHFKNCYGTPKKFVFDCLNEGKDVLLEIDVHGALRVKDNYPMAVLIFILPPSIDELRHRLICRNTEAPEKIEERIARLEEEVSLKDRYDFTVVNDDLNAAVDAVLKIIKDENKE